PRSLARTLALRVVNVSLKEADLTHAADQLAIYHRIYRVEISHKMLARVLGMSESALYRIYGKASVIESLRRAWRRARSATQIDQHEKERADHPRLRLETAEQSRSGLKIQDEPRSQHGKDEGLDEPGLHACSADGSVGSARDLPFESLYHAAVQIALTGEP